MFDDLRDLYQELILDHGRKPRNFRRLEDATNQARGDNPMCGDRMELQLKLDGDIVADLGFQGRGCAISMARPIRLLAPPRFPSTDRGACGLPCLIAGLASAGSTAT